MTRVQVTLSRDHLQGLIRSPLQGLAELIWNALDADATKVEAWGVIDFFKMIDTVHVIDNGHGMTEVEAKTCFGALGESWKRRDRFTREERRVLHGCFGKGRYGAFGIGRCVSWRSVARYADGGHKEIVISGRQDELDTFDLPPAVATSEGTGTHVVVADVHAQAAKSLAKPTVLEFLVTNFALYLESYPVEITWGGDIVAPAELQELRTSYDLPVSGTTDETMSVVIIEWKKHVARALYLCDQDGVALHEVPPHVSAPNIDYTAYVRWRGFRELGHQILLAEAGQEQITPILEAARETLRAHFRKRIEARRGAVVRRWKEEKSYPYAGDPQSQWELAERELFDVVALTAAKAIENAEAGTRKLSLRLIKEALENNPTSLHHVLADVIDLSAEQLDDLRRLLVRTPLASVVASARTITDRLAFISGLDALVFDKEVKRQTLERRQLHRILAEETWIFGEEYRLTGDDDRLLAVLKRHLLMLGEDVELAGDAPLTRLDGTQAIPDLVLSRSIKERDNRLEHLVVELKRPSVVIGRAELAQIQDYAHAVGSDERFNQPNVHWEFWIIGNELDSYVMDKANQVDRPPGVVDNTGRYRVIAKTWAEVIADARHRLKFVASSLQYRSTRDGGIEYLRRTHAKLLPEALQRQG